jgi:hypothetical protein
MQTHRVTTTQLSACSVRHVRRPTSHNTPSKGDSCGKARGQCEYSAAGDSIPPHSSTIDSGNGLTATEQADNQLCRVFTARHATTPHTVDSPTVPSPARASTRTTLATLPGNRSLNAIATPPQPTNVKTNTRQSVGCSVRHVRRPTSHNTPSKGDSCGKARGQCGYSAAGDSIPLHSSTIDSGNGLTATEQADNQLCRVFTARHGTSHTVDSPTVAPVSRARAVNTHSPSDPSKSALDAIESHHQCKHTASQQRN